MFCQMNRWIKEATPDSRISYCEVKNTGTLDMLKIPPQGKISHQDQQNLKNLEPNRTRTNKI